MTTRWLAALALLAVSIAAAPAAEWPTRPIRIIAPSTPGGAADTFARLLAEFLPPLLHQPLIVDNRCSIDVALEQLVHRRLDLVVRTECQHVRRHDLPDGRVAITRSLLP